jgi:hypothetical protein
MCHSGAMKVVAALIALSLAVPAGAQAQVFRKQATAKAKPSAAKSSKAPKAKSARAKPAESARRGRAAPAPSKAPFRLIVKAPKDPIDAELLDDDDVVVIIEE